MNASQRNNLLTAEESLTMSIRDKLSDFAPVDVYDLSSLLKELAGCVDLVERLQSVKRELKQ